MAVSFVGIGTYVHATGAGNLSIPLPAGVQQGDCIILAIETGGEIPGIPSGYHSLVQAAQANVARVRTLYKEAEASESDPVLAYSAVDHISAVAIVYRDVDTSVLPQTGGVLSNQTASAASIILGATTVGGAGSMYVMIAALATAQTPAGEWSTTRGFAITERLDTSTTDGNAASLVVSDGPITSTLASPSATFTPTATNGMAVVGIVLNTASVMVIDGTMAQMTASVAVNATTTNTLAVDASLPALLSDDGTLAPLSVDVSVDVSLPTGALALDATLQPPTVAFAVSTGACYAIASDRREQILARLATVLAGLGAGFGRNDPDIPDTALPKITLLDADEDARKDTFDRGRPPYGPNLISLTPEVYITLAADTPEQAGEAMSEWESTIVSAVLNDATLVGLCHEIQFHGIETAVETSRGVVGQMSLDFSFWYRLATEEPCNPPSVVIPDGVEGREAILEALSQIAQQTEGVTTFARNDLTVPDDESIFPRVIMLDSGELADPSQGGRGRPAASPNRVVMEPEIYILVNEDMYAAGPKLNRIRLMLLRGILNDPTLRGLAMDGDIRYEGCQTAMAAGRAMTGEMGMVISLARVSRP